MTSLRIAAAQSPSVAAEMAANIQIHLQFMRTAAAHKIDLLLFPELSLCGYELACLHACALTPDDVRLQPLRSLAQEAGMIVTLGAPLKNGNDKPLIGAITYFPDGSVHLYAKQHLHAGEELFVSHGAQHCTGFDVKGESVAMAICADIAHPQHASQAADAGASLYLAGVLESHNGYASDAQRLQTYASQFNMGVLMANHSKPTGGYLAAGRSAFWLPGGELLVAAPADEAMLVVAARDAEGWHGELHQLHNAAE